MIICKEVLHQNVHSQDYLYPLKTCSRGDSKSGDHHQDLSCECKPRHQSAHMPGIRDQLESFHCLSLPVFVQLLCPSTCNPLQCLLDKWRRLTKLITLLGCVNRVKSDSRKRRNPMNFFVQGDRGDPATAQLHFTRLYSTDQSQQGDHYLGSDNRTTYRHLTPNEQL